MKARPKFMFTGTVWIRIDAVVFVQTHRYEAKREIELGFVGDETSTPARGEYADAILAALGIRP